MITGILINYHFVTFKTVKKLTFFSSLNTLTFENRISTRINSIDVIQKLGTSRPVTNVFLLYKP